MLKSRGAWLVLGGVLGVVAGLNVAGLWPQVAVHAVATHGQDNFAIATGPIGGEVEAVYILDYLTGELKAAVLNLQTGKFMSVYEYNVAKDLAANNAKNPRYLMVTGVADLRRGGGRQLGGSVIYVAEFTSGQIAAYGLPWVTGRENVPTPFKGTFIPLDGFKFRGAAIRQ